MNGAESASSSSANAISWYEIITQPPFESFTLRHRASLVLFVGALLASLNLFGSSNPSPAERVIASAIIALCALPSWIWMAGGDRGLPLMPFFGMVFATYYAVPLFLARDYATLWVAAPISHLYVVRALELILLGLACVMAGYYGPQALVIEKLLPRLPMRWRRVSNVRFFGIGFGLAGLAIYIVDREAKVPDGVAQILAFASDLCLIGMCILFALQLSGRLDRISKLYLWGLLIPLRFWFGLGSGLTSQGLIVAVTLIFTYASVRRRIPWAILLGGSVAFFVLRPAEGAYRLMTWQGGMMERAPEIQKTKMLAEMVRETFTGLIAGDQGSTDELLQISLRRLDLDTLTLAEVLHDTPGIVPYWYGESYYPLIFKPVPRLLWPGKPPEITGQTFGHRYGLLDQSNYWTSYNLPQLIEGYVNFGVPGLMISMFLFGLLYRATQTIFVHPQMGFGALVGGIYLCINLLQIESATSLVLGGAMWALIYVGLLNLLIATAELEPLTARQSASST